LALQQGCALQPIIKTMAFLINTLTVYVDVHLVVLWVSWTGSLCILPSILVAW